MSIREDFDKWLDHWGTDTSLLSIENVLAFGAAHAHLQELNELGFGFGFPTSNNVVFLVSRGDPLEAIFLDCSMFEAALRLDLARQYYAVSATNTNERSIPPFLLPQTASPALGGDLVHPSIPYFMKKLPQTSFEVPVKATATSGEGVEREVQLLLSLKRDNAALLQVVTDAMDLGFDWPEAIMAHVEPILKSAYREAVASAGSFSGPLLASNLRAQMGRRGFAFEVTNMFILLA